MTNGRYIKWDRGSIEELRRWLVKELDPPESSEEESKVLDYPWPVTVKGQQILWGTGTDASVNATLAFDDIFGAEDYEVRTAMIGETPETVPAYSTYYIEAGHMTTSQSIDWVMSLSSTVAVYGHATGSMNADFHIVDIDGSHIPTTEHTGTSVHFSTATTYSHVTLCPVDATHFQIWEWTTGGSGSHTIAVTAATVSGTTISYASPVTYTISNPLSGTWQTYIYPINVLSVITVNENSGTLTVYVHQLSGGSIVTGSPATISVSAFNWGVNTDASGGVLIIPDYSTPVDSSYTFPILSVSGTTITTSSFNAPGLVGSYDIQNPGDAEDGFAWGPNDWTLWVWDHGTTSPNKFFDLTGSHTTLTEYPLDPAVSGSSKFRGGYGGFGLVSAQFGAMYNKSYLGGDKFQRLIATGTGSTLVCLIPNV